MNTFTKKGPCTKHILVLAWLIFSIPFIIWVLWSMMLKTAFEMGVKNGEVNAVKQEMTEAYEKGRLDAVTAIMSEANNESCAAFPINIGKNVTQLVNLACLQGAIGQQEVAPQVPAIEEFIPEPITEE